MSGYRGQYRSELMSIQQEHAERPVRDTRPFITVTLGGVGWFAVHMWWNPDGFWEPWQTGIGRFEKEEDAAIEGREWAEAEGLRYIPRKDCPA